MDQTSTKVTAKQRALALALASGGTSKADAYRSVYNHTDNVKAADANARQTMRSTGFKLAMAELQAKLERPELKDAETTRQYVMAKLYDLSASSRIDGVQLQAAVAIGKATHVNLFGDAPVSAERPLGGSAEEIRQSIARMVSDALEAPEGGIVEIPRSDITGDVNPKQGVVVVDVSAAASAEANELQSLSESERGSSESELDESVAEEDEDGLLESDSLASSRVRISRLR